MIFKSKNNVLKVVGMVLSATLPMSLAILFGTLLYETWLGLSGTSVTLSLFDRWQPSANQFGFLELLVSTLFATVPATLLAIVAGTLAALAIYLETSRREAFFAEFSLSLWAGFPSVIIGILLLVSVTQVIGFSLASAILAIATMILPPYVLSVLAVLRQTDPTVLLNARSVGLGTWQLVTVLLWPMHRRTLMGLIFLTFSRGLGEATGVALVSGGIVRDLPPGLLDTVNTVSTAILRGYPVAGGAHEAAIYLATLVLLILVTGAALLGAYLRLR